MQVLDDSLLIDLPAFRALQRSEMRAILDAASTNRFPEGSEIFHEGHDVERFYVLLDGYVRVIRTTENGDQIIVLHIPPGQLFGIAPAMHRNTYPATAIAAKESITLSWPIRLWLVFAEQYPGFAAETYNTIGQRLEQIQQTLSEMATQAVENRVANALLRLTNQSGRKVEGGIAIDFPVTRQNIADMTGTTLHTVSRLLAAWEKEGLIRSTRKHIIVTAPHKLVLMSNRKD